METRKIVSKQYHPVIVPLEKPVFSGTFADCTSFPLAPIRFIFNESA